MPLPDPSIITNAENEGRGEIQIKTFDQTQLADFMAQIKSVMDGFKIVLGDKDLWMFTGSFFVNFVGPGTLSVEQAEKIDKLRVILSKEGELSYADAGTMLGIISSLMQPAIVQILEKQAPGILNIIGILTRLGGLV